MWWRSCCLLFQFELFWFCFFTSFFNCTDVQSVHTWLYSTVQTVTVLPLWNVCYNKSVNLWSGSFDHSAESEICVPAACYIHISWRPFPTHSNQGKNVRGFKYPVWVNILSTSQSQGLFPLLHPTSNSEIVHRVGTGRSEMLPLCCVLCSPTGSVCASTPASSQLT